jgi:hypothetical protein
MGFKRTRLVNRGVELYSLKLADRLVVIDSTGHEVSGAAEIGMERSAHFARCGALSPALCELVAKEPPGKKLRFFVYPKLAIPDFGPRSTEPAAGALEARNSEVLAWTKSARALARAAIESKGMLVEAEDPSTPLVFGYGTLAQLSSAARDERLASLWK